MAVDEHETIMEITKEKPFFNIYGNKRNNGTVASPKYKISQLRFAIFKVSFDSQYIKQKVISDTSGKAIIKAASTEDLLDISVARTIINADIKTSKIYLYIS